MIGDSFTPTLEVLVKTVPWNPKGGYLKRIFRWLCYTRRWKFSEDWYFRLEDIWLKAPKGFIFDGASIPKPLRFLVSPTGVLFVPAIFHDFGYRYDKLLATEAKPTIDGSFIVTKEFDYHPGAGKSFWDRLFRDLSLRLTKLYVVPNVTYLAVSLFGLPVWRKYRKREIKND